MRIAIITDQHFGIRRSSDIYWNYMFKFYDNIFFPYLKKNGINTIVNMGDTTDDRKQLSLDTIYKMKTKYYDKLTDYTIHTLVGNHCTFYKDSNKINSPSLVLKEYDNVKVYSECSTITIDNRKIDMIPWITSDNFESTKEFINNSKSEIALGHLEANGATMFPGHTVSHGTDPIIFKKYVKVVSGHLHFRHQFENIYYIGNPYELNTGDIGATRGFAVLDTDTLNLEYVNNPYKLFKTIYYDDVTTDYNNPLEFNPLDYAHTFTRLVVQQKHDLCTYDTVVTKLYAVAHELKIIEKNIIDEMVYDDSVDVEQQDTITLFSNYLDEMKLENAEELKSIIKGIYSEVHS